RKGREEEEERGGGGEEKKRKKKGGRKGRGGKGGGERERRTKEEGREGWMQVGVGAAVLGGCMLLFERRIAKAAWRLVRRLR
ncbi:hypothetical protein ACTMRF_14380, partial [Enterococcus faecium]|uniref:hypothetical protein n=1 Tax=Enterococcus faecium TaxID=1352 RepID=UPI003F8A1B83